jgi:hypothetical protein
MTADVTSLEQNLRHVFGGDRELSIRIARLSVLFEDLRLESAGAREPKPIEPLDQLGRNYRRFYFLRRTLVSLDEFAAALSQLNSCAEWKRRRPQFEPEQLRA